MSELLRVSGRPLALIALLGCCAGTASASSLVALHEQAARATPSILVLGQTAAPADVVTLPALAVDPNIALGHVDPAPSGDPAGSSIVSLSRSVIALGEPDIADENVAAIGGQSRHGSTPMVIRGGVIGDAFSPPAPPATAEKPKGSDQQESQSAQSPDAPSQPDQAAKPSQTPAAPDAAQPE